MKTFQVIPPIVVKLQLIIRSFIISKNKVLSVCVSLVVVFVNIDLRIYKFVKSVQTVVLCIYPVVSLLVNVENVLLLKRCNWKVLMVSKFLLMCNLSKLMMWHPKVQIIAKLCL